MLGSGISSESIWTPFDAVATANVREPRWKFLVAWTRVANVENYATIGVSQIGGTDIIEGTDTADIVNADQFDYFDETDKVIRIEYERTLIEPLGGTSIAMADIVLDNSDLRFTPDQNATIGTALRPNRPLKVFIGFFVEGQEKLIPIIEGLSLSHPFEDKVKRQVAIQAYDYMRWLNEKPQETAIYQNQRSDQIIADILARAGVGSNNYELDQGLNTVGFAWFEKGQTAGDRIRKIAEAEEAMFYQDENGILRFENRDHFAKSPHTSPVWTIDADDIIDWRQDRGSRIINRAIVKGEPRSVKGEQEIWRNGIEEEIGAGETKTIWASFENPVSDITQPSENTDYDASDQSGGAGSDVSGDISIVMTEFAKSAKLEITNNGASTAYLYFLRLRGTPATVDYGVEEVFEDDDSIADYNEQQIEIENPYIDKEAFAENMAQDIVRRHKNPRDRVVLTVRGIPQLQLRDMVKVKDQDTDMYKNYRVMKIQGVLEGGGFIQHLYLRRVTDEETL